MTVFNLRNLRRSDKAGGFDFGSTIVRVDRKSKWGNPYAIGDPDPNGHPMDRGQVIQLFRTYAVARLETEPDWLDPLRGRDLACWCAPLPCHAEVIEELLVARP